MIRPDQTENGPANEGIPTASAPYRLRYSLRLPPPGERQDIDVAIHRSVTVLALCRSERPLPSHRKPERCAVADDVAGGGRGEVGADDEDRLVGPFGEEARSSERGGLRIVVAE